MWKTGKLSIGFSKSQHRFPKISAMGQLSINPYFRSVPTFQMIRVSRVNLEDEHSNMDTEELKK